MHATAGQTRWMSPASQVPDEQEVRRARITREIASSDQKLIYAGTRIMRTSKAMPHLKGLDHTLAFLRQGYQFISHHCDELNTDIFAARILLHPVVCVRGSEAAEMFYGRGHFTRQGAMPPTTMRLLQDKGSVQSLDGAAHRHRKAMFVSLLMNAEAETQLVDLFRTEWLHAIDDWAKRPSIVLFDEANLVITRAICRWMNVLLDGKSDIEMAHELSSMIENAGSVSPAVLIALVRRQKTERYIEKLVTQIRDGKTTIPTDAPIAVIVNHRDLDGEKLSESAAAVEILNILRPVVAVGRFVMFAAMALKDHPVWRAALVGSDDSQYERFAEEVRRLYPFFPVIGGRTTEAFEWKGHQFQSGDWVLLDLHGTNHDPRLFKNPDQFDPGRQLSWRDQGYDFIPQGAGNARTDHRCPGEQFTVAILREAIRLMVEDMDYDIPEQDLSMPLNTMPAKPASGMILAEIRRKLS
jgi:fatty-acid peroxygenase